MTGNLGRMQSVEFTHFSSCYQIFSITKLSFDHDDQSSLHCESLMQMIECFPLYDSMCEFQGSAIFTQSQILHQVSENLWSSDEKKLKMDYANS